MERFSLKNRREKKTFVKKNIANIAIMKTLCANLRGAL